MVDLLIKDLDKDMTEVKTVKYELADAKPASGSGSGGKKPDGFCDGAPPVLRKMCLGEKQKCIDSFSLMFKQLKCWQDKTKMIKDTIDGVVKGCKASSSDPAKQHACYDAKLKEMAGGDKGHGSGSGGKKPDGFC